MIKRVFKPFWSYDVEKTEQWLTNMAKQGYHFVELNTVTRYFLFKEDEPQEVHYHIGHDKTINSLPATLVDDNWEKLFEHRSWYILVNKKTLNEIKTSPVREGIVKHNRKIMYIFGVISLYMLFSLSIQAFLVGFSLLTFDVNVEVVSSPLWVLTPLLWMVGLLVIYSFIKLYRTNKRLSGVTGARQANVNHYKERQLKKSGKLFAKRKFGWMYAPDKLERWLERMEEKGYNLRRINRLGTKFIFIKGRPRMVSYCADYQNNIDEGYFEIHGGAGWKPMFSSKAFLSKWTIWSCVYEEGEERPQLYSDRLHMLKHAKRVAITYVCMFTPLVILYVVNILLNINMIQGNGMLWINWMNIIIFGPVIIEFGTFVMKSCLYYGRVKKSVRDSN